MQPNMFPAALIASAVLLTGASAAAAQTATDFPNRTITIVSPFPAGGMNDIVSRMVAERLGVWKQSAIVENKGGANGGIGATAVARSPADGHTLLMANGATHGSNLALYSNLGYHPITDFRAVGNVTSSPVLLVVSPKSSFNSVADVVKYAKDNPGKVTWGSSGTGSTGHLSGEILKKAAGIEATHVAYRGDTPALTDVLSGNITMALITYGSVLGLVESGDLRVLAKATDKNSTILPKVSTMEELGFKDFVFSTWFALVTPAGTPDSTVKKINDEVRTMLTEKTTVAKLATLGAEPQISTPQQADTFIKAQVDRIGTLVKELGLKVN